MPYRRMQLIALVMAILLMSQLLHVIFHLSGIMTSRSMPNRSASVSYQITDAEAEGETDFSIKSLNRLETVPGRIPKILHQTYSSVFVAEIYRPMIEHCLLLNPDWKYYLWTDDDADVLMARFFPEMLKTAKLFKHRLERADVVRYMALFVFGGIYLDMDVECRQPFFPVLSNHSAFLDREHPVHSALLYGIPFTAMNSAMGAMPGHPFFQQAVDKVLTQKNFGNPISSTGPIMLTGELKLYRRSAEFQIKPIDLLPHYLMSPELDRGQNWKHICHAYKHLADAKEKLRQHRLRGLTLKEEACLELEANEWKILNDSRYDTVAAHKFLHLGHAKHAKIKQQAATFNVMHYFGQRVHFYAKEAPLMASDLMKVIVRMA